MGLGKARNSSKKRLTSNGSKASKSGKTKASFDKPKDGGCIRIFSAILTRVLFALHTAVALWRVSFDYPKEYLYFLSIGLFFLVIEMIFALGVRKGKEYKWFCPSVLFYLMSVVPCLWLLELSRFNAVTHSAIKQGICNITETSSQLLHQIFEEEEELDNLSVSNRTRRHIEMLVDADVNLRGSHDLIKRIRRDAISDENAKPDKNKRRRGRRRRKKSTTTGATLTTKITATQIQESDNGLVTTLDNSTGVNVTNGTKGIPPSSLVQSATTGLLTSSLTSTTSSSDAVTTRTKTTTSTAPITSIPSAVTPESGDDAVGLDNLGSKIKEGFSNIEKETANILNKTVEVLGELNRTIDSGTWILLLHQVLLFVLVIGRWLLPKGEITRDQLSQLLLVFIGVGADILEFVTETVDGDELDETSCVMILHFVIYAVWSWSLLQFTLVLTASKSRKTRVGFDAEFAINENKNGCCGNSIFASADLWGILVTLFLQDLPFLATRLYILIVYNLKHQMMIFFTGKNALVVILQCYRIVVLKLSRMHAKDDTIDESEIEPLRGTLHQLARRATVVADNGTENVSGGDEIRDATFKRTRDGSVVVKIHLEGEETLRKKRKKSAAAAAKNVR